MMRKSPTAVVPVVIGALGSVPSDLEETLLLIGLDKWIIPVLKKTVILGTLSNIKTLFNSFSHKVTHTSCVHVVVGFCFSLHIYLVGIGIMYQIATVSVLLSK